MSAGAPLPGREELQDSTRYPDSTPGGALWALGLIRSDLALRGPSLSMTHPLAHLRREVIGCPGWDCPDLQGPPHWQLEAWVSFLSAYFHLVPHAKAPSSHRLKPEVPCLLFISLYMLALLLSLSSSRYLETTCNARPAYETWSAQITGHRQRETPLVHLCSPPPVPPSAFLQPESL